MSAPRSLRAAIDAKCRDCGGQEGGARYWRVHVSACPVTDCPLWAVRPLASRNAPPWLSSREQAHLPPGWRSLPLDGAIAAIQGDCGVMQPETGRNSVDGNSDGLMAHEARAELGGGVNAPGEQ